MNEIIKNKDKKIQLLKEELKNSNKIKHPKEKETNSIANYNSFNDLNI
jgi:hypothetical protein